MNNDRLKEILADWGFPVLEENGNSVVFRYQLSHVQATLNVREDVWTAYVLSLTTHHADNAYERELALKTCNAVTSSMLVGKAVIDDEDDVIITTEFYFEGDDFETILERNLETLVMTKSRFHNMLKENREVDDILSQLQSKASDDDDDDVFDFDEDEEEDDDDTFNLEDVDIDELLNSMRLDEDEERDDKHDADA